MSFHDDTIPLRHMLDGARAAVEVASGSRRPGSLDHLALREAVRRVGTAASHVSGPTRVRHPGVAWEELAREGARLVAEYDRVDSVAVRQAVEERFPALVDHLERVLAAEEHRPLPAAAESVPADQVTRRLAVSPSVLAEFCRRRHIKRLLLFGSVLRADFGPASDVDVLVEFEPGRVPGLAFFAIQDELAALLGRPTDLVTAGSVDRYLRDRVLQEAQEVYASGA